MSDHPLQKRIERGHPVTAEWGNAVSRGIIAARRLPADGDGGGMQTRQGYTPAARRPAPSRRDPPASAPFPWGARWCWGLEIDGDQVTIHPGIIRHGNRYRHSGLTRLTVTEPATLVCWELDVQTASITVVVRSRADLYTSGYAMYGKLDSPGVVSAPVYDFFWTDVESDNPDAPSHAVGLRTVYASGVQYPQIWGAGDEL